MSLPIKIVEHAVYFKQTIECVGYSVDAHILNIVYE